MTDIKTKDDETRYHWYSMSFLWQDDKGGLTVSSATVHVENKRVTADVISKCRRAIGAPDATNLISCSYLGWMTKEENEGYTEEGVVSL
jgi:hypothetical protein